MKRTAKQNRYFKNVYSSQSSSDWHFDDGKLHWPWCVLRLILIIILHGPYTLFWQFQCALCFKKVIAESLVNYLGQIFNSWTLMTRFFFLSFGFRGHCCSNICIHVINVRKKCYQNVEEKCAELFGDTFYFMRKYAVL